MRKNSAVDTRDERSPYCLQIGHIHDSAQKLVCTYVLTCPSLRRNQDSTIYHPQHLHHLHRSTLGFGAIPDGELLPRESLKNAAIAFLGRRFVRAGCFRLLCVVSCWGSV